MHLHLRKNPAPTKPRAARFADTLVQVALICGLAVIHSSAYAVVTASPVTWGSVVLGNSAIASSSSIGSGPGTVSPNPVNFGSVAVGSSATKFVELYNSGSSAIGPVTVSITGANAADFTYSSNGCYLEDLAKSECRIGLLFSPRATGTRTATLNLVDNATNSPQEATLTGTGTPANTSMISISPSSYSWGPENIGTTAGARTFTLTASGGSVSISNIAISGTDPGDFMITGNTCGSSLGSGSSCAVSVAFKATKLGDRVALLSVTDSGNNSPQTREISGEGAYSAAQGATITVNLGSRSGGVSIPANILGTEYLESLPTNANRSTVASGGFTSARYRLQLEKVFPTSANTPSWGLLDSDITKLKAAGVHPIAMVENTPKFLQPSPLKCSVGTLNVPTSFSAWGQLAAQVATHLEQTYPRFVQYYEIWNEPNTTSLCGADSAARATEYMSIYAAAAPAIKNAVKAVDGATVNVGGPATAGVDSDFTPLLTNPATAPYVDFYSYHLYLATSTEIRAGMSWTGAGGTPSLYSMILNSGSGIQARYMEAINIVKASKTPKGANTPIFYDEYNDDWAFLNDCCRNNPTYSPLYNSMVVAQLFNSVYRGANQVPSNMTYFAAGQITFCILAIPDPAWDCQKAVTGAQAQPYPQWYTYNLIFGGSYLDLKDGGHMASSVSLSSGAFSEGLIATAYYTPSADSVLIINPTATSFSGVTLQINNPGTAFGNATLYTINAANPHVSSWPAYMFSVPGGTQTTFDLPGYSVIAVSLK